MMGYKVVWQKVMEDLNTSMHIHAMKWLTGRIQEGWNEVEMRGAAAYLLLLKDQLSPG